MDAQQAARPSRPALWLTGALLASVAPVVGTALFGPQSGLESMVILVPWAGMVAAHVLLGPLAWLRARVERHRTLLLFLSVYLLSFAGLHLWMWALANDVPERVETLILQRRHPADYELQQLARGRAGSAQRVRELVAAGARVDRRSPRGRTPLHDAAVHDLSVVRALLEAGADPDVPSRDGGTPLLSAIRSKDVAVVEALLAHGADPDLVGDSRAPICAVLSAGSAAELSPDRMTMLEALLRAGVTPDAHCHAFGLAARQRQIHAVRAMLAAGHRSGSPEAPELASALGAAANQRDADWITLLVRAGTDPRAVMRRAVERRDAALLAVLLEAGADPNAEPYLVDTARSASGDALTDLLLRAGADPNASDASGRTPFIEAARAAHDENIRRFAALGGDPDAHWNGEPLVLELQTLIPKRRHVPALLIELGADVNVSGREGRSPLMRATRNGDHALMRQILDAGADLDARDAAGRSAVHHATEIQHLAAQSVAILAAAGADLEATDAEGRTPLCLAQQRGRAPMAAALESHGSAARDCAPKARNPTIPIRIPRPR